MTVESQIHSAVVDLIAPGARIEQQVPRHRLPLVFSNGDYSPLNVLAVDDGLTGWVDFEHAGFEYPLIGLPEFLSWSEDSGWSLARQLTRSWCGSRCVG